MRIALCGQWTSGESTTTRVRLASNLDGNDPLVLSDALPDDVFPLGAQLAQDETQRRYFVNLNEEEVRGGHTVDAHVGKTDEELLAKLGQRRFSFPAFSLVGKREGSFESIEAANNFVNRTLEQHKEMVDMVAAGRSQREFIESRFGYVTGREAFRSSPDVEPYMRNTYGVGVEIRHDRRTTRGYRVHTAYPKND